MEKKIAPFLFFATDRSPDTPDPIGILVGMLVTTISEGRP